MPTPQHTQEQSLPARSARPQQVLACVLCQQRKVKCDRRFPCANCTRHQAQCVPATQTRHRKRRFPERELLDRIRRYEDLLRQNNVKFEPLHESPAAGEKEFRNAKGIHGSDEQPEAAGADWPSPSTAVESGRPCAAKDFWHAMNQGSPEPSDDESLHGGVREAAVRNALYQLFDNDEHLLLGSRKTAADLSAIHPEPAHIFRLWQVYLDNVNPLLKVTHTPSLQERIIQAIGNVTNIPPALEALMFSIYCMSILSLDVDDCQALFGSSKEDLLAKYQFGCRQALLSCELLRSSDCDCLTALYLYLVSVRPYTDPRSLSSMLGVAIRIAERMGIHSESASARCSIFEAEMRRRLWWSLMLFDTRISELAGHKTMTLSPAWDCRIPLNVHDSDLRAEMKQPPAVHGKCTDALFTVVRSELAEFVRHATFHLDFTSPALKPIARDLNRGPIPEGGELVALEKRVEEEYLRFCDPDIPLHFMTIWTTRASLFRCRLVEHYSKYTGSSVPQTEVQRDAAISHTVGILECDTKIFTSPLTKGYQWLLHLHFPFPAYIHIVQDLRRRPVSEQAERAWEAMSDNYEARSVFTLTDDSLLFQIFSKMILQAWDARQAAFGQLEEPKPLYVPRIVSCIKSRVAQIVQNVDTEQPDGVVGMGIDDFPMSMPMGFGSHSLLYGMGGHDGYAGTGLGLYPNIPGEAPLPVDVNQWGLGKSRDW
ncbi:putative transcriptional regulatory protein [Tolypocladium ophioglossoides CBS 100239]|uniref:Putative transcriptional regulatory protein n=1 Tax=Tolypocladium ophioglossoides (strain CBS 100239) TaxID=1163406 RepID=A0A0L0NMR1_TOLOC|nr:putative transcriptional regulatory protein [Tolypocladium ophioglossoides CBS 100239]